MPCAAGVGPGCARLCSSQTQGFLPTRAPPPLPPARSSAVQGLSRGRRAQRPGRLHTAPGAAGGVGPAVEALRPLCPPIRLCPLTLLYPPSSTCSTASTPPLEPKPHFEVLSAALFLVPTALCYRSMHTLLCTCLVSPLSSQAPLLCLALSKPCRITTSVGSTHADAREGTPCPLPVARGWLTAAAPARPAPPPLLPALRCRRWAWAPPTRCAPPPAAAPAGAPRALG